MMHHVLGDLDPRKSSIPAFSFLELTLAYQFIDSYMCGAPSNIGLEKVAIEETCRITKVRWDDKARCPLLADIYR